jgi:anaerobic selenocysteine-containing dehydrogenase
MLSQSLRFAIIGHRSDHHDGRASPAKPCALLSRSAERAGRAAMRPRIDINLSIDDEPDEWVHSACLLCSNGCGLDIAVKDGRIVGVRGQADHPVSLGHLGPKGEHAWVANHSRRRGTTPMIRRRKGEPLRPVSWAEAMDFFVEHFRDA